MTAVTFTHTGSLKSAGWSDWVPESAPDSNGIYWWDINRSGTTLHGASGSGYLSYNPSTGLFTFPEGTLSSVTINGADYWSYTDSVSLRLQFLKTAPFNGQPPTTSSGPTVTSITVASTVSATREFTVTHTGTLTANDIGYKINGVDITTLTSPNTPITNLQTTSTGSTFDSYTLSSTGYHIINIGSQYLEFYKSVSLNAQFSFPELTNAGLSISFPTTQALWLAKAPGYDSLTLYNDGAQYKGTSQFNGYDRIEYLWIGTKYFTNSDPTLRGFKAYVNTYIDETATWNQGTVSYIDPVARYESTGLLTSSFYAGQTHVSNGGYYTFDFVSLLAQDPTESDGGGKRRRYPIISTNLFDRQKSIYSIGLTHKDETLF